MKNVTASTRRKFQASKLLKSTAPILAGLTFVGLMSAGIVALHLRDSASATLDVSIPVSVRTGIISLAGGYTVTEHFAGRLEPARQTTLAFERGGTVTEVLFEEGDRIEAGAVVARLDSTLLKGRLDQLEVQAKELQNRFGRRDALSKRTASVVSIATEITSVDIELQKSVIVAPFAGVVAARAVDEGTFVSPGMPVLQLLEVDARQARIGVSVEAAAALSLGKAYSMSAGGRIFQGRLISKRPDLQTGSRTVTAVFEASGAEAVPFGEIVELLLARRVAAPGTWLPVTALCEGRKGLWSVMTVKQQNGVSVIEREAVELVYLENNRVFVKGDLTPGTRVVLEGTNRVIPGQHVALASVGSSQ